MASSLSSNVVARFSPTLYFKGNCEAALKFYESLGLGKAQNIIRYKDKGESIKTPLAKGLSSEWDEKFLHSHFSGKIFFQASDGPDSETMKGSALVLEIEENNVSEGTKIFNALSEGGRVTVQWKQWFSSKDNDKNYNTFYGNFTDRFGVQWAMFCPVKKESSESPINENNTNGPININAITRFSPVLYFKNNCEAALKHYESVGLGKQDNIIRYKDKQDSTKTPLAKGLSSEWDEKILHSHFAGTKVFFQASDGPDSEPMKGIALLLDIEENNVSEGTRLFNSLSEGGRVTVEWKKRENYYGNFTDRFGVQWAIFCRVSKTS